MAANDTIPTETTRDRLSNNKRTTFEHSLRLQL